MCFVEHSRMTNLKVYSRSIIMVTKPQLTWTVAYQKSHRTENTRVKHTHLTPHVAYSIWIFENIFFSLRICFTVTTDIYSSYHKLISYYESVAVLIVQADRLKVEAHCGDLEVQTQKHAGPRFTSCLFLTLSNNLSLDKQEQKLKKTPESIPHR